MNDPLVHGRYDPKLYRALHQGNPGDIAFYQDCCAEADSILELGCGDGRVLFELAPLAKRAVGVEPNPEMRAFAAARRDATSRAAHVELLDGDMCTLDLGERFDRIVVPYSGLFCLRDDAAVLAALKRIAAHLTPDGALVFDGYHVVGEPDGGRDPQPDYLTTLQIDGASVDVYEQDEHWPKQRDCEVTYTYRFPDAVISQVLRHHYFYADDIPDLLAQAGLALRAMWGGFAGQSIDDESDQVVVVAVLAEGDEE